jgi:hypothetical protein
MGAVRLAGFQTRCLQILLKKLLQFVVQADFRLLATLSR